MPLPLSLATLFSAGSSTSGSQGSFADRSGKSQVNTFVKTHLHK